MLRIREQQLEILRQDSRRSFEEELAVHLRECFAARCRELGDDRLVSVIRSGIERAARRGFTARREICLFLNLMFVLGADFDRDPRHPWVGEILDDELSSLPAPLLMDRLYARAIEVAEAHDARPDGQS